MTDRPTPNQLRGPSRELAKQRVARVFREGGDWRLAASHNDLPYTTARRAVLNDAAPPKQRGGVRQSSVKMTVEVMAKLEEYIDEDCRVTLSDMCDRLRSDMGVVVGKPSVHRAFQGMLYSSKKLRIEKATMNNTVNKDKRMKFGWSRIGERAVVQLPPSQGKNLHLQGGVSALSGVILLRTHEGSITTNENARFIADLFVAAQRTEEYRELPPTNKIVVVTDNAPAHSGVEDLARELLFADGIMNGSRLVLLRLGPYSPMLNPIEGCWNVLKAHMRRYMATKKQELLVRGEDATYTAHRLAIMKEAVEVAVPAITRRLVWRLERHALKAGFVVERGVKLGS
ncbi:unnamed protein product [Phytophthora fragariaefolia]|uniref:Unnamed protein product n=1 Tax=Phytophthora fragariaefolia TaxID=1490495 RepID=A0A9W6X0D0_9STRA|nr:unnamed protein product [Phytophthora fragariaefolia]